MKAPAPSVRYRPPFGRVRSTGAALVCTFVLGSVSGCAAHVRPATVDGYAVVYAGGVPDNLGVYPRTYWRGDYAYYVDGRWLYPTSRGWVYFREPPPPLVRARPYVQEAPPAYPRGPGYRVPARPNVPAYPGSPPPATRIR